MNSSYYVYAIQRHGTELPLDLAGLDNRPLAALSLRDLQAVVSELERERVEASAENVLRHERVVEAARQMGPAIPVRFGTILSGAGALTSALDARYAVLEGDLRRLGDKVEMGLSALWQLPAEMPVTEGGSPDSLDSERPGTRYLQARLREHRREAQVRERAIQLARAVNSFLASHALEYRPQILPTPRLALRVAYLMHPSGVGDFERAFGELARTRADVRFLLSGPWPPYSFVTAGEGGGWSKNDGLLG